MLLADVSPGPLSCQRSRRGVRESKATAEDAATAAAGSDYKESPLHLQTQAQAQHRDSSHIKSSKQSPTQNADTRASRERDRDRQREFEKEAEKEKERLREREIRAFREFSKDLPFKQPLVPQIRRVAGSSYLPSPDFDADENASHLPIPNILSNGMNTNNNSSSSSSSSNSSSNSNHASSSGGGNDGTNGAGSGAYFNAGHVSLGPLGDTGIRLRGGLHGNGVPGPAPLAMNTGRPQFPSIESRSSAMQGSYSGSGSMNASASANTNMSQGYHASSSTTENGINGMNNSNSNGNSSSNAGTYDSSSSSRSNSNMNANSSSSGLSAPGVSYRQQPQPLGHIPVQHSASNMIIHAQGQGNSNSKYRDNPLSSSSAAMSFTAPTSAITVTTATSSSGSHSVLGQNTELTSSGAFDDGSRHLKGLGPSGTATHANVIIPGPGEGSSYTHTRLNSRGSLFDQRSDASFYSESDSTNYSTINSTMSTVMGVSTGSNRTGDMNTIASLMNMGGLPCSALSSNGGSGNGSASNTLTMNLNAFSIRDRGAAVQSLLDPLDAMHYGQCPLQTLPQIRDSNDMMAADSKTSSGARTHTLGVGVGNAGDGHGLGLGLGLGGIQSSKQHTRSKDHKHGTKNGKGKSSVRSTQPHSHSLTQSQHPHASRNLNQMQDKGIGGGAPKFR